jgi:hypothetical protein
MLHQSTPTPGGDGDGDGDGVREMCMVWESNSYSVRVTLMEWESDGYGVTWIKTANSLAGSNWPT